MEKTELYKQTAERIKTAKRAGVTMAPLVRVTGISQFRLSSIANFGTSESYRHQASLTEAECAAVNMAIDNIKAAL